MGVRFYNTMTRRKEDFRPLKKGEVRIYSCGPTVYDTPHIGNLRAFLFSDILRRYLKFRGFKVKHVMNITDVDDKTIRDSKKEGLSLKEFTEKYTRIFFDSLERLNAEKAEIYPKATEHIEEIVVMVKALLKKGIAYKGDDGSIYYRITRFDDYGKLSGLDPDNLRDGARVSQDEYTKEHPKDFALWKAWTENDGEVFWETDIGKGRPGWHIECSAMSTKHLGKTLDIHTGGVDLIFPHHENEIAQSEGAYGKQFVRYWLHNQHVMVEGEKMSKSLGNFLTLDDLIKRGHDPRAVRYALVSAHYRSRLNVTDKSLWAAQGTVEKIDNFMDLLSKVKGNKSNKKVKELVGRAKKGFRKWMDDDLNMGPALAEIFDFMSEVNKLMDAGKMGGKDAKACIKAMGEFDKVLGVLKKDTGVSRETVKKVVEMVVDLHEDLKEVDKESEKKLEGIMSKLKGREYDPENFDQLMTAVAEIREALRKKKEYNLSDKIRSDLGEIGIILEDTEEGIRWRPA